MGRSLHGPDRVSRRAVGSGSTLGTSALLWFRPVFGLGMMEVGLIVIVAVMLFPAKELPKLARSIAQIYGQVRKTAEDFRNTVLEDEDLREPIDEIKGAYNDARFEVRDAERKARQQLAKAQMDLRLATARRLQAEKEARPAESSGAAELPGPAVGAPDPVPSLAEPSLAEPSLAPVAVAAAEPDLRAPVAGVDPRVIAARRAGVYMPPRVAVDPDDASESSGSHESSGSRGAKTGEGVV